MNVAFIPVRGGSKSIPLKNIKEINGKPLIYWSLKAACECLAIDRVYVATDSDFIREAIRRIGEQQSINRFDKVEVIGRGPDTATDTASTESAMLEFAYNNQFSTIVLIQATSPMITDADLAAGFAIYEDPDVDSVLSAVKQKRFLWQQTAGFATPQNYDFYRRPRRQEFEGYYVENGAFYITSRQALLQTGSRISGKIKIAEMEESSYYEIDEPSDWMIVEQILRKRRHKSKLDSQKVKMVLTDCDGCLTDGGMYYSESGDELKKFNAKDGLAFSILRKQGLITGIVTGEDMELNRRRAEKMKLDIIESGCRDKLAKVKELASRYHIELDNIVFVGDDENDLEVIKNVGYSFAPADATESIKQAVDYVLKTKGGRGVIREMLDILQK